MELPLMKARSTYRQAVTLMPNGIRTLPIREKAMPGHPVCGDTVMANFVVSRHPAPKLYTVRGMVTDKVTGEPISFAMIEFSIPKAPASILHNHRKLPMPKGHIPFSCPAISFVACCTAGVSTDYRNYVHTWPFPNTIGSPAP